ncbi:uncharacterized protein Tco025E_09595, partial [Trypanosoma conorhini]
GVFPRGCIPSLERRRKNSALEVAKAEAAGGEENEGAKRKKKRVRLPIPKGFYDSVLSARWSHVLGFPEGEGEDEVKMRMEVKAPAKSWEDKMLTVLLGWIVAGRTSCARRAPR